jgi:hypothetical protein
MLVGKGWVELDAVGLNGMRFVARMVFHGFLYGELMHNVPFLTCSGDH